MSDSWRQIYGFPNYEISREGKVRRACNSREKTLYTRRDGTISVSLQVAGRNYTKLIHVLLLEAFVCPRPRGMRCLHLNGVKDDNRLENLKWVKQTLAPRKGPQRERITTNDLSERERQIVEQLLKGKDNQEIALELSTTRKTVLFHLTNVYKKQGVKGRVQLIVKLLTPAQPIAIPKAPPSKALPIGRPQTPFNTKQR